ncbi:hypothetical protein V8G54_019480, partial [Vigna mungo]
TSRHYQDHNGRSPNLHAQKTRASLHLIVLLLVSSVVVAIHAQTITVGGAKTTQHWWHHPTSSLFGKMLPTSAITRSLSMLFQGESFWITTNKAKPTTNVISSPKLVVPRKLPLDDASSPRGVINRRGQVSFIRPASPNKVSNAMPAFSSSSRGVSRLWLGNGASYNEPVVLSFVVDVKRGRVGENRTVEAHSLRLLHNHRRNLKQQRFCG